MPFVKRARRLAESIWASKVSLRPAARNLTSRAPEARAVIGASTSSSRSEPSTLARATSSLAAKGGASAPSLGRGGGGGGGGGGAGAGGGAAWKKIEADPWSTFAPLAPTSSPGAPATIVSPSIATEKPRKSFAAPSEALSLALSVQLSPVRVNTYTAPLAPSS
jgi:hypothetical protein